MTEDNTNYKENYEYIISLYDVAEKIVDEADEDENSSDAVLVDPLLKDMDFSINEFIESYIGLVENEKKGREMGIRKVFQAKVETSMRTLFTSMNECYDTLIKEEERTHRKSLVSIADVISSSLRGQVHKVIGAFVGLVDLSANKFMKKSDIEELERKDAEIALRLHEASKHRSS